MRYMQELQKKSDNVPATAKGNGRIHQVELIPQILFNNFAEKSDFFRNSAPLQLRYKHTKMKKALPGKAGSFH